MLPDFSYYQGLSIFPESSLVPQILHNWRLFSLQAGLQKKPADLVWQFPLWTSFSWRRSLICCWVSLQCLHESQTTESILICRLVWQPSLQKACNASRLKAAPTTPPAWLSYGTDLLLFCCYANLQFSLFSHISEAVWLCPKKGSWRHPTRSLWSF